MFHRLIRSYKAVTAFCILQSSNLDEFLPFLHFDFQRFGGDKFISSFDSGFNLTSSFIRTES